MRPPPREPSEPRPESGPHLPPGPGSDTPQVADGFPRTKEETAATWHCRYGNAGCTRGKPCPQDRGRLNRQSGRKKQRAGTKVIEQITGVAMGARPFQRAHEEDMRGPLRIEVKSGAQCGPAATRFLADEKQSAAARAVGDNRVFADILMPTGWGNDGLFQCRLSQLAAVIEALVNDA